MQLRKSMTDHISVLQLKSILARVRQQINMSTLTVAIRQHCIEQQQTHLKDPLLKFFLRCQTKTKRSGNVQWNRVINGQIRKMVSIEKLEDFMKEKNINCAFSKLQRQAFLDEKTKIQEKIYDEFSDLRGMQISDDVKLKTKYFFQWCQFMEQKRAIKRMKNKEIEDLKKAKTFHQYSVKFNSFMEWKQYIKRIRSTRERGYFLEQKTRKQMLTGIFSKIKEKTQIITIQKLLQSAVEKKLQNVRMRSAIVQLKREKYHSKRAGQRLNKMKSIWTHRFCQYIIKRGFPLMNKTSILLREQQQEKYRQMCLTTAWKGLKIMTSTTNKNIHKLKSVIKTSNIKLFLHLKKSIERIQCSSSLLKASLKKNYCRYLMKNIHKETSNEQQFIARELEIKKNYNSFCCLQAIKKLRKESLLKSNESKKTNLFLSSLIDLSRKAIINRLKSNKAKKTAIATSVTKIKYNYLLSLFRRRMNTYKQSKIENQEIKLFIQRKHEQKLVKYSLKGFKMIKNIRNNEYEVLNSVVFLIQKQVMTDSFDILQSRMTAVRNIERFAQQSERIVLKTSFHIILNKILSKKMKIKAFTTKQQNRIKGKLFDMLVKNKQIMTENQVHAKQIFIYSMKRQLIQCMKSQILQKNFVNDSLFQIERIQKQKLFKSMRISKIRREQYEQKQENVCSFIKTIRFSQYVEATDKLLSLRQEQDRRAMKIKRNYVKYWIKTIRKRFQQVKNAFSIKQQQRQHLKANIREVQLKLVGLALNFLHKNSQFLIERKTACLIGLKRNQIIKFLSLNNRQKKLKKLVTLSRRSETLENISVNYDLSQKKKALNGLKKKKMFSHTVSRINDTLIEQAEELTLKANHLQSKIAGLRLQKAKFYLISKMKNHYELKDNISQLSNQILKQSCKQLIKLYLKQKANGIKQFISLRHYASNLKRKGLRGLNKVASNSLLKQNRTQVQNNSKILMERSLDNARKKSKLIETIERYNMSRVSRVIR